MTQLHYTQDDLIRAYDAETDDMHIADWLRQKFNEQHEDAFVVLARFCTYYTEEDEQDLRVRVALLIALVRKYRGAEWPHVRRTVRQLDGAIGTYQDQIAKVLALEAGRAEREAYLAARAARAAHGR
jgi:hypothetical protein